MTENSNWVECVPNVSSADLDLIALFQEHCANHQHVILLHTDTNRAIERTVFTLVGSLAGILNILHTLFDLLARKVDLQSYTSAHPHIGALDVCPFILLTGISHQEATEQIQAWCQEVSQQHNLPIFKYNPTAKIPVQRHLVYFRRGGLQRLTQRMTEENLIPAYGPDLPHPRFGATVVGIRKIMVAYNINLVGGKVQLAKEIASSLRSTNTNSPFINLKAIGWYAADFERAQVSINIYDVKDGILRDVFDHCATLAAQKGAILNGSELIGLTPLRALARNLSIASSGAEIKSAAAALGLNSVKHFEPTEHILDLCFLKQTGISFHF